MRLVNAKGKQFKSTVVLEKITALTKSLDDQLFLVHVENSHDYEFNTEGRDAFIGHIKICYYAIKRKNLPIYGITGGLDKYRTPKKSKFINLRGSNKDGKPPPEENRLLEEDLYDQATANNNVI